MKPTHNVVGPSEKQFQAQVIEFARLCNWRCYHTHNSRRSVPGFPDLFFLRRDRQMVAELKVGNNKPTAEQQNWLDAFEKAGVPAYCWRPSDWNEIEEVLR